MLSLDDQVQHIKSDVLEISAELALLEEQLLFPATTQMALFVALTLDDEFRLDALHLKLNGEVATLARHVIKDTKEFLPFPK